MKRGTKKGGREGCVVRAEKNTWEDLERTARREEAKGAFIVRGRHPRENEIAEWLKEKEEEESAEEMEVLGILNLRRCPAPPSGSRGTQGDGGKLC